MGKYQSFDCVKVYGSNGVLLYIEAWWMDVSDPSGKNYQLARYCIMFPLSRMIAILRNLEKEGGINQKKKKVLWQIIIPRDQKMPGMEDFTLGFWQYSEENIYNGQ
ncbi:hypothetical protein BDE02_14G052600 [Populus trichocarpa]|jgi:hypothetical protein|nr:hypothetical protein BDE02_14G052600 [Populus trichocarpa]